MTLPPLADLDRKIGAILDYLSASQEPEGSFRTLRRFLKGVPEYARPSEFEEWHAFARSCTWLSATIGYHLCAVPSPKAAAIRRRVCDYLERVTENGLARYEPALFKPPDYPIDVDDTAYVFLALRRNGRRAYYNEAMVLENSDGARNIYTWIVPRWRHLRHPQNLLWVGWDFLRINARSFRYRWRPAEIVAVLAEYWRNTEPTVVANAIHSNGVDERTRPFLDHLIRRIEADDVPLQYYDTPIATYFSVARMYEAGIEEVGVLREKIVGHIERQQQADGSVEGPFNTALAALSLMYLGCWERPELDEAVAYLATHEMHDRGWKPAHFANDVRGIFQDGGAEVTATFFLEALQRYRDRRLVDGR